MRISSHLFKVRSQKGQSQFYYSFMAIYIKNDKSPSSIESDFFSSL